MRITKLGHCCLVIEENETRIMTDPGVYSTLQDEAQNIDYICITHEHSDHFHLESLKVVLGNNPRAKIITNRAVGKLLHAQEIPFILLEQSKKGQFGGVEVEGCGERHEVIYEDFGQVQNTGYFFANRFFYPGDAFYVPREEVEILALPVAGPWMKISDAIAYAAEVKPKVAFPVHDGMLKFNRVIRMVPQAFLPPLGISFVDILEGETRDF